MGAGRIFLCITARNVVGELIFKPFKDVFVVLRSRLMFLPSEKKN